MNLPDQAGQNEQPEPHTRKRVRWPPEIKAEAVRLATEGKLNNTQIGRQLGVHPRVVSDWVRTWNPGNTVAIDRHGRRRKPLRALSFENANYRYSREEISELVYGTVYDTLVSLRNRARATADPDWIRTQTADALAELDSAQWQSVIRFVASFRVVEDGADQQQAAIDAPAEPDTHRNGAVDPAD